jgi:hypothetical protein
VESKLIGDLRYIQAEAMEQRTGATQVYSGWNASGGQGRALFNVGSRIRGYVYLPTAGCRRIRAAAWSSTPCAGHPWPVLGIGVYLQSDPNDPGKGYINGIDGRVNSDYSYYQWYMGTHYLRAGWNEVYLDFRQYDSYIAGQCDANLYIDYVAMRDVEC